MWLQVSRILRILLLWAQRLLLWAKWLVLWAEGLLVLWAQGLLVGTERLGWAQSLVWAQGLPRAQRRLGSLCRVGSTVFVVNRLIFFTVYD